MNRLNIWENDNQKIEDKNNEKQSAKENFKKNKNCVHNLMKDGYMYLI